MPATVVLDEVHLTFRVLNKLSPKQVTTIRRVLNGKAFTAAVHRAIFTEMNKLPALKPVRVSVTR